MREATEMLNIDNLHAYYGKSHVLHGVSFNVQPGEIVALLGRNGSGRSTTAKAIMGLVDCQGDINWKGQQILGKKAFQIAHLGLVAGVAPTLGFIGTISGVIKIFYSISITENVSIGNISGGLYEKMISSGAGLIVGIIAFTGYHLLNGMIDKYALSVQKINLEFVNLIQRPDGN